MSIVKGMNGLAIAVTALALSGCASMPDVPSFIETGISGATVLGTATLVSKCYTPPQKSTSTSSLSLDTFTYPAAMEAHRQVVARYEICQLKTQPQILRAAAELSKFSALEIATSLAALEEASGIKNSKIQQIAERIKATPAAQLNVDEAYAEMEEATTELAVLQTTDIEHPQEVVEKAAIAKAKLSEASGFTGQSIGATVYMFQEAEKLSDQQKVQLYTQAALGATTEAENSDTSNLATVTFGTAKRVMKILTTAYKISDVLQKGDYDVDPELIKGERDLTRQRALEILGSVESSDPI